MDEMKLKELQRNERSHKEQQQKQQPRFGAAQDGSGGARQQDAREEKPPERTALEKDVIQLFNPPEPESDWSSKQKKAFETMKRCKLVDLELFQRGLNKNG